MLPLPLQNQHSTWENRYMSKYSIISHGNCHIKLWTKLKKFFFVLLGVHCSIYKILIKNKNFLYDETHHTWVHALHHSPLFHLLLMPGIVSTGIFFLLTYMCTQRLYYIHLPSPFPHIFPPPTGINSPDRTCSAPLFSDFVKDKKNLFVQDSCTGTFLVTFSRT
jgi:hypothetical protein